MRTQEPKRKLHTYFFSSLLGQRRPEPPLIPLSSFPEPSLFQLAPHARPFIRSVNLGVDRADLNQQRCRCKIGACKDFLPHPGWRYPDMPYAQNRHCTQIGQNSSRSIQAYFTAAPSPKMPCLPKRYRSMGDARQDRSGGCSISVRAHLLAAQAAKLPGPVRRHDPSWPESFPRCGARSRPLFDRRLPTERPPAYTQPTRTQCSLLQHSLIFAITKTAMRDVFRGASSIKARFLGQARLTQLITAKPPPT
jgi:hypothetical protein